MAVPPISQYRKILVIGSDEHPSLRVIADADLVVYGDTGRVLKDRHGSLRTLTPEEMKEVRKHAA